jgi:hypothetical protein
MSNHWITTTVIPPLVAAAHVASPTPHDTVAPLEAAVAMIVTDDNNGEHHVEPEENDDNDETNDDNPQPHQQQQQEEEKFIVERIIDEDTNSAGKQQFRIKWQGTCSSIDEIPSNE